MEQQEQHPVRRPAAQQAHVVRVTGFAQLCFVLGRGHRPLSAHQQASSNTLTYTFGPEAREAVDAYFVVRDSLSDVPVVSR